MSPYYEAHVKELAKWRNKYLNSKEKHLQYRGHCIVELMDWEQAKND